MWGVLVSTLVSLGKYKDHVEAYQSLYGTIKKNTFHSISSNVDKYISLRKITKLLYRAIDDAQLYNYLILK